MASKSDAGIMATVTPEVTFVCVEQIERGRQSRGSHAGKGRQARDGLAEKDWQELDQGWKRRKMERTECGRAGKRMDRRQMGQEDRTTKDGVEVPAGAKQTGVGRGGRRGRT